MQIPIRLFKGLYTNVDKTDIPENYFPEYRNIRTRPGFIESVSYGLSSIPFELEADETILVHTIIEIDNDKFENELIDNKLVNKYQQNLVLFPFVITIKPYSSFYLCQIWVKEENTWVKPDNCNYTTASNIPPKIVNENGFVKILAKEKVYSFGKLNRNYFAYDDVTVIKTIPSNYYLFPLVEGYNRSLNLIKKVFNYEIKPITDVDEQPVKLTIVDMNYPLTYLGLTFETIRLKVTNKLTNKRILYPNEQQDMICFKWNITTPTQSGNVILLGVDEFDRYTNIETILPNIKVRTKVKLTDGSGTDALRNEWFYVLWYTDSSNLQTILDTTLADLKVDLVQIATTNSFSSGDDLELVTTMFVGEAEYIINYEKVKTTLEQYALAVTINGAKFPYLDWRKTGFALYMRYKAPEGTEDRDYENVFSLSITDGLQKDFPFFIDKLSGNGLFLTQFIGKFFEEDNYQIITAYDDYMTAGGISYIIKNGNILFPVVGGGAIKPDMYYPENIITGVSGTILTEIANKLGIFNKNKELLTIIEAQPVEGTLLFFPIDKVGYTIRDKEDIIYTADGLFVHLREGIFLITDRERVLLSLEINDIIKDNYETGNIYYNNYDKELYYQNANGFYVYYFDMKSWSQIDFSLPTPLVSVSNLNKVLYFATEKDIYELVKSTDTIGYIKSHLYGAEALTFVKTINHLSFDYEGKIRYNDKEISSEERKQKEIHRRIEQRIPKRLEEFEIEFEGKIYNLEANFDIFPAVEK